MIHRQFYLNFYNNIFSFPLFYSSFSSLSKISISKLKISRIIFQYLCNCSTHHHLPFLSILLPFFFLSKISNTFTVSTHFQSHFQSPPLYQKYYHSFVEKFECTFQYLPDNCSNFTSSHLPVSSEISSHKFPLPLFHFYYQPKISLYRKIRIHVSNTTITTIDPGPPNPPLEFSPPSKISTLSSPSPWERKTPSMDKLSLRAKYPKDHPQSIHTAPPHNDHWRNFSDRAMTTI